jgi:hypothetical protein
MEGDPNPATIRVPVMLVTAFLALQNESVPLKSADETASSERAQTRLVNRLPS